jgi:hypothetical protein
MLSKFCFFFVQFFFGDEKGGRKHISYEELMGSLLDIRINKVPLRTSLLLLLLLLLLIIHIVVAVLSFFYFLH